MYTRHTLPARWRRLIELVLIHYFFLQLLLLSPQIVQLVATGEHRERKKKKQKTGRSSLSLGSGKWTNCVVCVSMSIPRLQPTTATHMYCRSSTWNRSLLSIVCSSSVRFCSISVSIWLSRWRFSSSKLPFSWPSSWTAARPRKKAPKSGNDWLKEDNWMDSR